MFFDKLQHANVPITNIYIILNHLVVIYKIKYMMIKKKKYESNNIIESIVFEHI